MMSFIGLFLRRRFILSGWSLQGTGAVTTLFGPLETGGCGGKLASAIVSGCCY